MVRNALLVAVLSPVGTLAADDFTDFSNNLATDLGPLLSLFGEAMTRQYLSESTAFIDYFIFAAAPLGIIAAVVSVIRVCGHPSLRAFVGRSQEGEGAVEAELCTSTSRDVCELFNNGGIARVLGRPNILELVYIPAATCKGGPACASRPASPRLFLFRSYLEKMDESSSEWTKARGSRFGRAREQSDSATQFAPKPNLSLNIGIKRKPYWVFIVVAFIGFILQAGVLVLAGFGAWRFDWNLNQSSNSSSQDYAPRMFIAGTLLLCLGMWSCAALIGQATQETTYRRTSGPQRGRLLWIQPGPQVIGDQSFDSFAVLESKDKRLDCWTTSRRRIGFQALFELLTFVAVTATMVGYVLQFIGLRGLNAWVSIAQLASTLTMSFLRGLLRMQRLRKRDNQLGRMPDLVSGYELDWIAFNLALLESAQDERPSSSDQMRCVFASLFPDYNQKSPGQRSRQSQDVLPQMPCREIYWHVTGEYALATTSDGQVHNSTTDLPPHDSNLASPQRTTAQPHDDIELTKVRARDSKTWVVNSEKENAEDRYRGLFAIRVQLAHLTGHFTFTKLEDTEFQTWKDSLVKVRASSKKLASAISQVAAGILEKRDKKKLQAGIVLRIKALTPECTITGQQGEQEIGVNVRPLAESSQNTWTVDSAQIEAILGLWMWSLVHDPRLLYADESDNQASLAEKNGFDTLRILSAGWHDDLWEREVDIQREMDLWLGPNATELSQAFLTVDRGDCCGGHADLWKPDPDENGAWVKRREFHTSGSGPSKDMSLRFFGWSVVYESLGLRAADPISSTSQIRGPFTDNSGPFRFKIQFMRLRQSLLDLCVQDLFVALAGSLAEHKTRSLPVPTVVENDGHVQMQSPIVSLLEKAFVDNDLGPHPHALACIIPSLRKHLRNHRDATVPKLMETADVYRRNNQWERAEFLLRSGCEMEWNSPANDAASFARVFRKTGELYRWSLTQGDQKRRAFGKEGIKWMAYRYGDTTRHGWTDRVGVEDQPNEIADIVSSYSEVAQKIPLVPTVASSDLHCYQSVQIVKDINDGRRTDALNALCDIEKGRDNSGADRAIYLASKNGWTEISDALLELAGR